MKLADLPPEVLDRIRGWDWDGIIEKHEGPERWDSELGYDGDLESCDVDFLNIHGYDVLLPLDKERHKNVTILRCIVGDGGESLTIFLKDTTYVEQPEDEQFSAGFMAICDRMPGEDFYVAILYHEWFIIDRQ